MPCTTLALALALSVTQLTSEVPLEFASEDDEVFAATFDSTGSFALISHLQTNSLTRFNVATGLVDGRLETGGFGPLVALPGSSDVLLLNRVSRALDIIDTGSMMVTASVPVGLQAPSELIVDSTGTRAVVRSEMAGEPVAVVSIASRTIERTINFAAGVDTLSTAPQMALAGDDLTLTSWTGSVSAQSLVAYDISSGTMVGSASIGASANVDRIIASGDRSALVVVLRPIFFGPQETTPRIFDALTIQERSFTFPRMRGGDRVALNGTGDRATLTLASTGQLMSFPTTGAAFVPGSPQNVEFGSPGFGAWTYSSDGTRLLAVEESGDALVFDQAGGLLGAVDGSVGLSEFSTALIPAILFQELFVAHSPRGGILTRPVPSEDRLIYLEVGSSAGPYVRQGPFNSGFGDEFDEPYSLSLVRGRDLCVVASRASDSLAVVDTSTATLVRRIPLARGPHCTGVRDDGRVIVGHLGGVVVVVDPRSGQETARFDVGGTVEQVDAEPGGTRAWLRVVSAPSMMSPGALVLVETEGPSAGEILRVDLAGTGVGLPTVNTDLYPAAPAKHNSTSVAFDFTGSVAYAASATAGVIETVDLLAAQIVHSTPVPELSRPCVLGLDPTGQRLFASLIQGRVASFTRSTGTLVQNWVGGPSTGASPRGISVTGDGGTVFVDSFRSTFTSSSSDLFALDAATGATLDSMPIAEGNTARAAGDDVVVPTFLGLTLTRFTGTAFSGQTPAVGAPARYATAPQLQADRGRSVVVQAREISGPLLGDELLIADYLGDRVQTACEGGTPNATGVQATLVASGSSFAGLSLELTASGLRPGSMFGMLVVGSQLSAPTPIVASLGRLCVGGSIGRLTSQVQSADASGSHRYRLDTQRIRTSVGNLTVRPGESWTFQVWHRDQTPQGMATSNTSTALEVTFR